MKLQICSVHDRALDAYMRPFFAQTIGQAIRIFNDGVNQKDTEMYAHPDDYDLYHLGEFDDQAGTCTNLAEGPKQIAIGKNAVDEFHHTNTNTRLLNK